MDLGLRDRAYVVTGGSRSLGCATARVLVAGGARVVLSARDPGAVAQAAADLGRQRPAWKRTTPARTRPGGWPRRPGNGSGSPTAA